MTHDGPHLLVSEIFGPTIQGEGLGLGLPSIFLRLAGCPLACSWCDTAYAWDWHRYEKASHSRTLTPLQAWDEVVALAANTAVKTLVVTGGEPASQTWGLVDVVERAVDAGWRVEMETSGTLDPGPLTPMLALITVSPKLSSAGMDETRRLRFPVLRTLAVLENVVFKFVIDDEQDLEEADDLVKRLDLPTERVMVMAQANDSAQSAERTRWLIPAVASRGYRVTPRLHTLLWGNERGR